MGITQFNEDVLGRIEPSINATPVVIAHRDWFDVIVVSSPVDGPLSPRELFHATDRRTITGDYQPKVSIGGPILDRDPAAVRRGDRLDVFAVGADAFSERLLHTSGFDGNPWSALRECGPPDGRITSGVAATSSSPGRLDVVAVGEREGRKGLLHWWSDSDDSLDGPEFLPCGLADRTPAIVTTGEGKIHAFGIDLDGRLWEWKVVDQVLAGPFEVASDAGAGGIGAAASPDGSINVVALREDRGIRRLVHAHADQAGNWRVNRPDEPSRLRVHRPAVVAWQHTAAGWFVGVQDDDGTSWLEPEPDWRTYRRSLGSFRVRTPDSLRLNPAAGASQHIAVTAVTGPKDKTFLNEVLQPAPLQVTKMDARATGYQGPPPPAPAAPDVRVNLTDWSWDISGTHGDAHWVVAHASSRPVKVEDLTKQLLEVGGEPWMARDLEGSWLGWYSPLDYIGSMPAKTFARSEHPMVHRFWGNRGSRPAPGGSSVQIVVWAVIRGPADVFGQFGVSLSEPKVILIPPVGETHVVAPGGKVKIAPTPRL